VVLVALVPLLVTYEMVDTVIQSKKEKVKLLKQKRCQIKQVKLASPIHTLNAIVERLGFGGS
jgi:hypothetical protein